MDGASRSGRAVFGAVPGAVFGAVFVLAVMLVGVSGSSAFGSTGESSGSWTPREVPHGAIVAVSCPTADSCVAVGSYNASGGHIYGLIETLDQGSWTAALAPLLAHPSTKGSGDSYLSDVACRGAGFCVAVGWYVDGHGNTHGLLETLEDGIWTPTRAPLPANVGRSSVASLNAVSCPALGSCVAVGSYFVPRPAALGLIETLTAGRWTASEAPPPPHASSSLDVFLRTVTCPTAGSCVTVGSYNDAGGNIPELIETLSHGTWTPTEVSRAAVVAVSCPAADTCVAVGSSYGGSGRLHGLIESLARGVWSAAKAPLPVDAASNGSPLLTAVTCLAIGSCVTVGVYTDRTVGQAGLVDALSGTVWSPAPLSLPAGSDTQQAALACPTATSCVAVGSYVGTNGVAIHGLVALMSGGSWTTSRAPLPADADGRDPAASLNDMTCPSMGTCVAVGRYTDSRGHIQGLIETLSPSMPTGGAR